MFTQSSYNILSLNPQVIQLNDKIFYGFEQFDLDDHIESLFMSKPNNIAWLKTRKNKNILLYSNQNPTQTLNPNQNPNQTPNQTQTHTFEYNPESKAITYYHRITTYKNNILHKYTSNCYTITYFNNEYICNSSKITDYFNIF